MVGIDRLDALVLSIPRFPIFPADIGGDVGAISRESYRSLFLLIE